VHRRLIAVALAIVLGACSTTHRNAPSPGNEPAATYFRVKDSGQRARPGAALVTCATQVGPGHDPVHPSTTARRPPDIVVGPVRWLSLTRIATEDARIYGDPVGEPFVIVKAPVAIIGTSSVTLSVPPAERDTVGLDYRRTDGFPTLIRRAMAMEPRHSKPGVVMTRRTTRAGSW